MDTTSLGPYLIVGVVVLLILAAIYSYRHKDEILREVFPEQFENQKKAARPGKARPNAKPTNFHGKHKPMPTEDPVKRTPKRELESNRAKRRKMAEQANTPDEEDNRISDLTLDTKGTSLSAMTINGPGTLLICTGKNHQSFMFAIAGLDFQMFPFVQQFTLHDGDISAISVLQPPEKFILVYSDAVQKDLSASLITFDDEAKVVTTALDFSAPLYKQSIQKMFCESNGKYVMILVDRQIVRVLDEKGALVHELVMPDKKCSDMCVNSDFTKVAISCGSTVEIYDIVETPLVNLVEYHKLKCNAAVVSMSWSKKTGQLVVASAEGLITVFKSDPKQGVALKFNSSGVRLVRACPESEFLAILSGKSKLQIVNTETGALYSQLQAVHRGEAHFLEWSVSGRWLFVASKAEPNVEVFHFVPSEDKK